MTLFTGIRVYPRILSGDELFTLFSTERAEAVRLLGHKP
jgi:hypothetical protein